MTTRKHETEESRIENRTLLAREELYSYKRRPWRLWGLQRGLAGFSPSLWIRDEKAKWGEEVEIAVWVEFLVPSGWSEGARP